MSKCNVHSPRREIGKSCEILGRAVKIMVKEGPCSCKFLVCKKDKIKNDFTVICRYRYWEKEFDSNKVFSVRFKDCELNPDTIKLEKVAFIFKRIFIGTN